MFTALVYLNFPDILLQEFSIEIPDVEADEIKTVQQGASFCVFSLAESY
jgi:acyl carrier protein